MRASTLLLLSVLTASACQDPGAGEPARPAPRQTRQPATPIARPTPAPEPVSALADAGPPDALAADELSGAGTSTGGFFDAFLPSSSGSSGQRRSVELTLRSTPPGAIAAVDGVVIGPTPTFWTGKMTGKPREFTFVLEGFALARYRFVPVHNGIVHAAMVGLARPDDNATRRRH